MSKETESWLLRLFLIHHCVFFFLSFFLKHKKTLAECFHVFQWGKICSSHRLCAVSLFSSFLCCSSIFFNISLRSSSSFLRIVDIICSASLRWCCSSAADYDNKFQGKHNRKNKYQKPISKNIHGRNKKDRLKRINKAEGQKTSENEKKKNKTNGVLIVDEDLPEHCTLLGKFAGLSSRIKCVVGAAAGSVGFG